jgi:hypothetical protein
MVTDVHHKELMILRQGSCPKQEKPVCLKSFSCRGAERPGELAEASVILLPTRYSEEPLS